MLFVLAWLFTSVSLRPPATGVDSITLTSQSKRGFSFYYINALMGSGPCSFHDGQSMQIAATKPIFFMESSALQVPYLLYPGDRIVILRDANGQPVLKTKDPQRNAELDFFRQVCNRYGVLRPLANTTYLKGVVTLKERDRIIEKKYEQEKTFLRGYALDHALSSRFKETAAKYLDYVRVYQKMTLYYPGFDASALAAFYRDSTERYLTWFSCDSCLDDPIYPDALCNFARLHIPPDNPRMPMIYLNGLSSRELEAVAGWARENTHGRVRDYLLAEAAEERMFDLAKRRSLRTMDPLFNEIKDDGYKKSLVALFDNANSNIDFGTTDPDKQVLYDKMGDSTTFDRCVKQDKLILVDFWASWCEPCLAELPYSKKLLAALPNDKFGILFISLDEDKTKWKNFTASGMTPRNSFLLKGNFASPLVTKYIKAGIPHFMLIRKDGSIISPDAPRPRDPRLRELIGKNL